MDHAGLSRPLELWKVWRSKMDRLLVFPSSSWLTAADLKETRDATEDGLQVLLTMLKNPELRLPLPILMWPEINLARLKVEVSRSADTVQPVVAMDFQVQSTAVLSQ